MNSNALMPHQQLSTNNSHSSEENELSQNERTASGIGLGAISVDTLTNKFVDIRQQDSGSNQSGSDSGLGYTTSNSSDYSNVAPIQHIPASHQFSTSHDTNTVDNNNSTKYNQSLVASQKAKNTTANNSETRTNPEDSSAITASAKSKHAFKSNDKCSIVIVPGETQKDCTDECNPRTLHLPTTTPIIKSLLKKSPKTTDAPKHNRNVSFNQTVIVFCEEVEALQSSSGIDQYEPPSDYRDPLSSFDPPEDYCDDKVDRGIVEREKVAPSRLEDESATKVENLKHCLNVTDTATNLTDDQLIGLLEDESLLNTLKLDGEDLSETDFPINYLNLNHSYLCEDAISDYDSDSESSLYLGRTEVDGGLQTTSSTGKASSSRSNSNLDRPKQEDDKARSSPIDQENRKTELLSHDQRAIKSTLLKSSTQKSMPARMKVSTLDNTHSSRLSKKKDDGVASSTKPDLNENSLVNNPKHHRYQANLEQPKTYPQSDVERPPLPLVIKQSTVEPVTLSKPTVVNRNQPDLGQAQHSNSVKLNAIANSHPPTTSKTGDQITTEFNKPREATMMSEAIHQSQLNSHNNQAALRNQLDCQICRVMENNRSSANSGCNNLTSKDCLKNLTANVLKQSERTPQNQSNSTSSSIIHENQPSVFNQSCVSCRETLLKRNVVQNIPQIRPAGIGQPAVPVIYQLVYVVDQNGNRVRALSIRQAIRNPNVSAPLGGQRVLIAQNATRFPNPASLSAQFVDVSTRPITHSQRVPNALPLISNLQYRLVGTNLNQTVQNQQNVGPRQHTVYYVRQPLDTRNIHHSIDSNFSSSKSFPDPHEIRRLDGLRGPTSTISLSHKAARADVTGFDELARQDFNLPKRGTASQDSEMEDPTFGFSKRPSVKVVSSNSNPPTTSVTEGSQQNVWNYQRTVYEKNLSSIMAVASMGKLVESSATQKSTQAPVSGSQTLDRRNQNPQQNQTTKDGLPSTSSMSNIHGTFKNYSDSTVTTQEPRISSIQVVNQCSPTNTRARGTITSCLRKWFFEMTNLNH